MRKILLAAGLAALLSAPALAHEGLIHEDCDATPVTSGDITVSAAFTRAMLPGAKAAGGYLTIVNAGAVPDRLTSAQSEAASIVQLHEMKMEGDMMKMGELPNGIEIPAGGTVTLSPGGFHVMFLGVGVPFKEGECVAVTLTFETAGNVPVVLSIADPAADAPPDHAH